jgi:hypothetical protein
MAWPLSQDYNEAVQNPHVSFDDPGLRASWPVVNALGLPIPCSGNFADVYHLQCPANQAEWAIKCFTREVCGLRERYQQIGLYLRDVKLPFIIDFDFLERGIRVQGQWFPALKMQWVGGVTLNEFVRANLDNPASLESLFQVWLRMVRRLREADIAHGDLQHGNVLLVQGKRADYLAVKLVDYDGMFVPALAGTNSGEVGHPAYQHPQRLREGIYNLEVDRFPELVIATALRCLLVGGRQLWEQYDNGDNLLFRQEDFEAPSKSGLFYELLKLNDSAARFYVENLIEAARRPLDQTPLLPALVGDNRIRVAPDQGQQSKLQVESKAIPYAFAAGEQVLEGIPTESPAQPNVDPAPKARKAPVWFGLAAVMALAALIGGLFLMSGDKQDKETPKVAEGDWESLVDSWKKSYAVIKADYGSEQKRIDVTQKVKDSLTSGEFPIVYAGNQLAGDPAPNHPKWMNLDYQFGLGKVQSVRLVEGDAFFGIDPRLNKGIRIRGASKELEIRTVRYGHDNRWVNVTDKAKTIIREPYTSFRADGYSFLKSDPAFGVHKHFIVWFDFDGSRYLRVIPEGSTASLLTK